MLALLGALVAGALTTLAPCVLPLLPVIVGGAAASDLAGSAAGSTAGGAASPTVRTQVRWVTRNRRALVITASLGASITLFTLILKATTALLVIDPAPGRSSPG